MATSTPATPTGAPPSQKNSALTVLNAQLDSLRKSGLYVGPPTVSAIEQHFQLAKGLASPAQEYLAHLRRWSTSRGYTMLVIVFPIAPRQLTDSDSTPGSTLVFTTVPMLGIITVRDDAVPRSSNGEDFDYYTPRVVPVDPVFVNMGGGYWHPHVNSSAQVCLGVAKTLFYNSVYVRPADCIDILEGVLSMVGRSPFCKLSTIVAGYANLKPCFDCGADDMSPRHVCRSCTPADTKVYCSTCSYSCACSSTNRVRACAAHAHKCGSTQGTCTTLAAAHTCNTCSRCQKVYCASHVGQLRLCGGCGGSRLCSTPCTAAGAEVPEVFPGMCLICAKRREIGLSWVDAILAQTASRSDLVVAMAMVYTSDYKKTQRCRSRADLAAALGTSSVYNMLHMLIGKPGERDAVDETKPHLLVSLYYTSADVNTRTMLAKVDHCTPFDDGMSVFTATDMGTTSHMRLASCLQAVSRFLTLTQEAST